MSKNIRRGNTVAHLDTGTRKVIARKGLIKFFDLVLPELYTRHVHKNLLNYVLGPPREVLENGGKVLVLKTLKANGENA